MCGGRDEAKRSSRERTKVVVFRVSGLVVKKSGVVKRELCLVRHLARSPQ